MWKLKPASNSQFDFSAQILILSNRENIHILFKSLLAAHQLGDV